MQKFKFPDERESPAQEPSLELELEDAEGSVAPEKPEIEIVDDTPEEDRDRPALTKEPEEPTEEELAAYSDKVQKRIKQLTHARHDERRKAESLAREKEELERAAKMLADENRKLQKTLSEGSTAYITKSKALAERDVEQAKKLLKDAYEAGDSEALVAAQEMLYRAQQEMTQVSNFKPIELQPEQNQAYTTSQQTQSAPAPQLDEKVANWAHRNTWFENPQHTDMTAFAYGVHNQLVRTFGEGYTQSDEYYHKIDAAMQKAFPDYFSPAEPETPEAPARRQSKSVVAPATRTTAPQKIRLTVRQQNVAKKLGIPLELYAKKLAEMENANG